MVKSIDHLKIGITKLSQCEIVNTQTKLINWIILLLSLLYIDSLFYPMNKQRKYQEIFDNLAMI